jgi:AmmeMemoRadiSam system protein B
LGRGLAHVLSRRSKPVLLVISSDLNHFASDAETRRVDAQAIAALESLDPSNLYHTVRKQNISMCGVLPACIALECLQQMGQLSRAEKVAYATSADVSGDTSRVVGYAGMLFA